MFLRTIFGYLTVYYAIKAKILTWPSGMLSEIMLFALFFQIQLYSDMFLQVFYFFVSIYGWYFWRKKANGPIRIRAMSTKKRLITALIYGGGTIILGLIMSNIHIWFPTVFTKPASFAYADAFTTVGGIIGTFLMARRLIENWIVWALLDVVSTLLYFSKDVYFLSLQYFVFCIMAVWGFYNWYQLKRNNA